MNSHHDQLLLQKVGRDDGNYTQSRMSRQFFQPRIGPTLSKDETEFYSHMIHMSPADHQPHSASTPPKVVVVGAGLAGLSAARELKKVGAEIVLLEKSDRVGGRCRTMHSPTFAKGVWGEAGGGMRFPSSHKIVDQYLKLFQLDKVPFANMKDKDGLFFFDGIKTSIQTELQDPESLVSRVIAEWKESIQPMQEALCKGSMSWEQIIDRYSNTSLLGFLRESGWSEELIVGFGKYGE
jgi:choline dehydrogenase-like flavoprotein